MFFHVSLIILVSKKIDCCRRFQTTPMNATACAEMFSSIPNQHPAFSKIRSMETK